MSQPCSRPARLHAFSLIESAIVLALVGLVIGGIWYAASSIQTYRRFNMLNTGILQIRDSIWNGYKNYDMAAWSNIAAYVAGSGGAPRDWAWNGFSTFKTPDGIEVYLQVEFANRPKLYFSVGSASGQLPKAVCLRLRNIFYDDKITAASLGGDTATANRLREELMVRTGGIRLNASSMTCDDDETFQLDFYRRSN